MLIKPRPGHEKRTREIADSLQKVEGAITDATRRLKFNASSVPKLSENPVAVLDVWNDAVYLMSNRLEAAGIKITAPPPSSGGGFNDYFYVDWLKEAFLNLLLNSLNAFSDRPKHNRWIRLDLRDDYEKATHYRFDYSDSAGGLITTKIQVPEAVRLDNPTLRLQELIFLPKVSSRKGNGVSVGWGLYLVRQAINGVHHGSVRCTNGKDGCIFEFEIPKHLDKRA